MGRALCDLLGAAAVAWDHSQSDLLQPQQVIEKLKHQLGLRAIINAAAYTQVDKAESEFERANLINAIAPGEIAAWALAQNLSFIHYSTDYVFSGSGTSGWREVDQTQPLNVYGRSKLSGEQSIQKHKGRWLILRTSWVYNETGQNFLNTMLRLGADREELRIVNDQIGAPTYASDLASATLMMLQSLRPEHSGIYHVANAGETSWFHFAQSIFALARAQGLPLRVERVLPITSAEFPTPAKRPLNSRLNMSKFENTFGFQMPTWQDALRRCWSRRYAGI